MESSGDDARVVRLDRVEVYKDRENQLWGLTWSKRSGQLALVKDENSRRIVFMASAPGAEGWEADLSEVRFLGDPPPSLGMRFAARRSMRVDVAGRRWIVTFTGERSDSTELHSDIQMERLSGDLDPLTALRALKTSWDNRRFWSESRIAKDAWSALLPRPPRSKRSSGRYSAEFRAEAVSRVAASDSSVTSVARELGVSASTLRRWVEQAR